MDRAVRQVLEQRGQTVPPSGLTPQDVFYRQVSHIQEILGALQEHELDVLKADVPPGDMVSTVSAVNAIFCVSAHHPLFLFETATASPSVLLQQKVHFRACCMTPGSTGSLKLECTSQQLGNAFQFRGQQQVGHMASGHNLLGR